MFEKVILVDIVVLMQEFFIYFKFLKTLFLFVSAVVLIVLLIQIFVKFWSFFLSKKLLPWTENIDKFTCYGWYVALGSNLAR